MFKKETNMSMRRGCCVQKSIQYDGLWTAKQSVEFYGSNHFAPLFVSSNADMIGVRSNLSRIKENELCG